MRDCAPFWLRSGRAMRDCSSVQYYTAPSAAPLTFPRVNNSDAVFVIDGTFYAVTVIHFINEWKHTPPVVI